MLSSAEQRASRADVVEKGGDDGGELKLNSSRTAQRKKKRKRVAVSSGHIAKAGGARARGKFHFFFRTARHCSLHCRRAPTTLSCSILQGVLSCVLTNWCLLKLETGSDWTIERSGRCAAFSCMRSGPKYARTVQPRVWTLDMIFSELECEIEVKAQRRSSKIARVTFGAVSWRSGKKALPAASPSSVFLRRCSAAAPPSVRMALVGLQIFFTKSTPEDQSAIWGPPRSLLPNLSRHFSAALVRPSASTAPRCLPSPSLALPFSATSTARKMSDRTEVKRDAHPFSRGQLEGLMTKRFFYIQAFEIYGGVGGLYDYGPTGAALQANIINQWRNHFIIEEEMLELDTTIMTLADVLKTSGHVDKFADWMCKDTKNGEIFRADHLVEGVLEARLEGDKQARAKEAGETIAVPAEPAAGDDKKTKKKKVKSSAVKLDDALVAEYTSTLAQIDNFDGKQLGELIRNDCWDAEIHTSYGWIECVGCADRSAYDLTVHSKRTKKDLVVQKAHKEPKVIDVIRQLCDASLDWEGACKILPEYSGQQDVEA
ncbi:hypothetical protein L1887_62525 [Cichorium endivia]|nr:hypothetical protein L1887_62525 [Cichorium endivia]